MGQRNTPVKITVEFSFQTKETKQQELSLFSCFGCLATYIAQVRTFSPHPSPNGRFPFIKEASRRDDEDPDHEIEYNKTSQKPSIRMPLRNPRVA